MTKEEIEIVEKGVLLTHILFPHKEGVDALLRSGEVKPFTWKGHAQNLSRVSSLFLQSVGHSKDVAMSLAWLSASAQAMNIFVTSGDHRILDKAITAIARAKQCLPS